MTLRILESVFAGRFRSPKSLARNNKTWTPNAVSDALPTGQGCVDGCNDAELRQ